VVHHALEAAALEHFLTCWQELDDPRTSNASLHDFHCRGRVGRRSFAASLSQNGA
jgi:hypothetical protein